MMKRMKLGGFATLLVGKYVSKPCTNPKCENGFVLNSLYPYVSGSKHKLTCNVCLGNGQITEIK